MRRALWSFVVVAVMGHGSLAHAVSLEDLGKPGLWQVSMKNDALKKVNLPPEVAEKLRQMGREVPDIKDGSMVTKVCVTKEMMHGGSGKSKLFGGDESCRHENLQIGGGSFSADVICQGHNINGTGHMKGVYVEGKSYSMTYDFDGKVGDRPTKSHHEMSGTYLGSDCGNVKPVTGMMGGSQQ